MLRVLAVLSAVAAMILGGVVAPPNAEAYWYGPAQNLSATDLGGGRTQFSWSPPNKDNYRGVEPSVYWVTVRVGFRSYSCEGSGSSSRITGTTCTVSGLPYGVAVTLDVQPWTPYIGDRTIVNFVLCCELPAAPTNISATAGNGVASVTWGAPSNAGRAGNEFSYSVEIRPGGVVCRTTGNSCEAGGLINGISYTFYISASNKTGTGPAGASTAIIPVGPPSEPLAVQAFLQKGSALVAWQGPASTGGTQITRYVAVSVPDGLTCESSGALECTVRGLSNGATYTFTVTAYNAAGQGGASASSQPAKLLAVPSSPTAIKTTRKATQVLISWGKPKSAGGSNISGYVVTSSPDNKSCVAKSQTRCSISGLRQGQSYVFTIQARNKSGLSIPGRSKSVTIPAPPPQAPPAPAEPEKQDQVFS